MPQVVSASFGEEDCIEQYIMDERTKRVWGTDRCRSKLLCYVALSSCIVQPPKCGADSMIMVDTKNEMIHRKIKRRNTNESGQQI